MFSSCVDVFVGSAQCRRPVLAAAGSFSKFPVTQYRRSSSVYAFLGWISRVTAALLSGMDWAQNNDAHEGSKVGNTDRVQIPHPVLGSSSIKNYVTALEYTAENDYQMC